MKRVIIGLERSRFNYLYKYDHMRISNSMILESDFEKLCEDFVSQPAEVIRNLDTLLPIYEREDEVLLIEVNSSQIDYQGNFSFSAVQRLIPLNDSAKEILINKLNSSLSFDAVLPVTISSSFWTFRQLKLRRKCASDVLSALGLKPLSENAKIQFSEPLVSKISGDKNSIDKETTLSAVLKFNTTPNGIPDGNVEGLSKIIGVGYIMHGKQPRTLLESPLYHLLIDNREQLNRLSFQKALNMFEELIIGNKSIVSLRETLDSKVIEGDVFRFCYYFFGLKRQLEVNKDNLRIIEDLLSQGGLSMIEFSQAVYLLALIMSYERLHESLQKMKQVPLLKLEAKDGDFTELSKCSEPYKSDFIQEKSELDNSTNDEVSLIKSELKDNGVVDFSKVVYKENIKGDLGLERLIDSNDKQGGNSQISNTLFETDINKRMELLRRSQALKGQFVAKARDKAQEIYAENEAFSFSDLEKHFLNEKDFLKKGGELKKGPASVLDLFRELD